MNPGYNHACNTVHKKEMAVKEENSCSKKCCENKTSKKENHDCDGKCRHSGCNISTLQFVILTSNDFDLENNGFNFSLKETISYSNKSDISSGFTSIWLKPKIT